MLAQLLKRSGRAFWELDVFGRIRRNVAAQSALVSAAQHSSDEVRVDLSAEFYIKVHANRDDILQAAHSLGMSSVFVGVILVAIVGNAAEHTTAILVALKDKMDLAFNIVFESSKQIAMFVAPVLVLASMAMGQQLTLEFTHMEVAAMADAQAGCAA